MLRLSPVACTFNSTSRILQYSWLIQIKIQITIFPQIEAKRKVVVTLFPSSLLNQYLPYGKAVFVQISDEYAADILQTALFTVIVPYIFTSSREYPANKVGLTKK